MASNICVVYIRLKPIKIIVVPDEDDEDDFEQRPSTEIMKYNLFAANRYMMNFWLNVIPKLREKVSVFYCALKTDGGNLTVVLGGDGASTIYNKRRRLGPILKYYGLEVPPEGTELTFIREYKSEKEFKKLQKEYNFALLKE